MSTRLSDYDYVLPQELIAQRPLERREDSRMMVLHGAEQKIEHRQFRELKAFLQLDDLLVLNDTRVLAARRFSDNCVVEFLFLERICPRSWKCMVTPGRKMRVGATTTIDNVCLRVEKITADGARIVTFDKGVDVYARGSMPLPHMSIGLAMKRTRLVIRPFLLVNLVPWLRLRLVCISRPRFCMRFRTRS